MTCTIVLSDKDRAECEKLREHFVLCASTSQQLSARFYENVRHNREGGWLQEARDWTIGAAIESQHARDMLDGVLRCDRVLRG